MHLLFIYGTLLSQENEYGLFLKSYSRFVCEGKVEGKLYDIKYYPGAVMDEKCSSHVFGTVLEINDLNILKVIDDYEGFGSDQTQPNEFIRLLKNIETDQGEIECWVYEYNLPIDTFKIIESGDYLEFLSKKKSPDNSED